MAITINSNIGSAKLIRQLAESEAQLGRTYERLSAGMRITRPSDDSAGLAISTSLQAKTRVLGQASRNISDAVSYFSIADSALTQLSSITQRQAELAQQSANGTLSVTQRRALSRELNALVDEFNRIVHVSRFNDLAPLTQNGANIGIQADAGSSGSLNFSVGGEIDRAVGIGTFSSTNTTTIVGITNHTFADFNQDGKLDLAATISGAGTQIRLGNGDGTFGAVFSTLTDSNAGYITAGDFTGDGIADLVTSSGAAAVLFRGNGNGTLTQVNSIAVGNYVPHLLDQNMDGKTDLLLASATEQRFYFGNGNGTLQAPTIRTVSTQNAFYAIADYNNDGISDVLSGNPSSYNQIIITPGNSTNGIGTSTTQTVTDYGTWAGLVAADFNMDGNMDAMAISSTGQCQLLTGRGDGIFAASASVNFGGTNNYAAADVNGDGLTDIISGNANMQVAFGKGDGTFATPQAVGNGIGSARMQLADLNGDGCLDFTSCIPDLRVGIQNVKYSASMPYLNITTASGAKAAMSVIAATRDRITLEQSIVGAHMSRLESAASLVAGNIVEYSAAAGRITDVDVAMESAQTIKYQILQQATVAILAQSNQDPAIAINLIRG